MNEALTDIHGKKEKSENERKVITIYGISVYHVPFLTKWAQFFIRWLNILTLWSFLNMIVKPWKSALERLVKAMKKKAPTALKLIRRDSISSDGGSTISDPETPGILTEDDYQNCFMEEGDEDSGYLPTSELLRKVWTVWCSLLYKIGRHRNFSSEIFFRLKFFGLKGFSTKIFGADWFPSNRAVK